MSEQLDKEKQFDSIMSQIMTTEEASEIWGVTSDHIKRWCSSGKVISRKKGKTWLILRDQSRPTP